MKVYHQVGHNSNWNLEALTEDKCGDGLILSPVHQKRSHVAQLGESVRKRSIFDPQFYLPNSQKKNLSTYDFFPETISGGFQTITFPHVALDAAKGCVDFQLEMEFEKLVIPARFDINFGSPKYYDKQLEYTVEPFLKAISVSGTSKAVLLSMPIVSAMLLDEESRTGLLNWATSFSEVTGVYLLVNDSRARKQIQSKETLLSIMTFAHELRAAQLDVVVGHLNSESVPLSLVDGVDLTMGSFENTRMFSIDKFLESDEERRGPKPRIYIAALLNWIQFGSARDIRNEDASLWAAIYAATSYADSTISAITEPYFNQPALYKHHFLVMYKQLTALAALSPTARHNSLRKLLFGARSYYEQIAKIPVDLDVHGGDGHIQPWLDAINSYFAKYLKAS